MNVTVEDQSAVKKRLTVEVPQDRVHREVQDAFRELSKTAAIKGFRPGKAPRSVLERKFGKDLRADVASRLIQESFVEALRETRLAMVGTPDIDPPELDENRPFVYVAAMEVQPELQAFAIRDLPLRKRRYRVTDEELEAQLQLLRRNLARLEKLEEVRPVQAGDAVLLDYEGLLDGRPFAETQRTEDFSQKVGDGKIHPDFDAQLVGMLPGSDQEIPVTFPADYANAKLAGLTIAFQVRLKEIRVERLPDLDDAMARQLGPFESLEDLRRKITENLEKGYARRVEQELNEQIFTALIDQQAFEVPETMVAYELEGIVEEAQQSFAYHNVDMEKVGLTREMLNAKYRDTALRQVKRHLILGKVIEQEGLKLEEADLQQGFQEMADNFKQPVANIQRFYEQSPDKLDIFKHALLEKQAIKLILDNSRIEEVDAELEKPADAPEAGEA
jgi:trigger factor